MRFSLATIVLCASASFGCERKLLRLADLSTPVSFTLRSTVAVRGQLPLRIAIPTNEPLTLIADDGTETAVVPTGSDDDKTITIAITTPAGVYQLRSTAGQSASVLVLEGSPTITSVTTAAGERFGQPTDQILIRGDNFDPRSALNNRVLIDGTQQATVLTATSRLLIAELASDPLATPDGATLQIDVQLQGPETQGSATFSLIGIPRILGAIPLRASPNEPVTLFLANSLGALLGCDPSDASECDRALSGLTIARGAFPLTEVRRLDVSAFPGAPSGAQTAISARIPGAANMKIDDTLSVSNKRGSSVQDLPLLPGGDLANATSFDVVRFSTQEEDDRQLIPMSSGGLVRYQRNARRLEYFPTPGDLAIARVIPGEGRGPEIAQDVLSKLVVARVGRSPARPAYAAIAVDSHLWFSRLDHYDPWVTLPYSEQFAMLVPPQADPDLPAMALVAYDDVEGVWNLVSAEATNACPQRRCATLAAPPPFASAGPPALFERLPMGSEERTFISYFTLNGDGRIRPILIEVTGNPATSLGLTEVTNGTSCAPTGLQLSSGVPLHLRALPSANPAVIDAGTISYRENGATNEAVAVRFDFSGPGCSAVVFPIAALNTALDPIYDMLSAGVTTSGGTRIWATSVRRQVITQLIGSLALYEVPDDFAAATPWQRQEVLALPGVAGDAMNAAYFGPASNDLGALVGVAPNPTSFALSIDAPAGSIRVNELRFPAPVTAIRSANQAYASTNTGVTIITPPTGFSPATLAHVATVASYAQPPMQVVTQATTQRAWVIHHGNGLGFDVERFSTSGVADAVLSTSFVDADISLPVPGGWSQPTESVAGKHRLLPLANDEHYVVAKTNGVLERRSLLDPAAIQTLTLPNDASGSAPIPVRVAWLPSVKTAFVLTRTCSQDAFMGYSLTMLDVDTMTLGDSVALPATHLPCSCPGLSLAVEVASTQDMLAVSYPSAASDCSTTMPDSEASTSFVAFSETAPAKWIGPVTTRARAASAEKLCQDGIVSLGRDFLSRFSVFDTGTQTCSRSPQEGDVSGEWTTRELSGAYALTPRSVTSALGLVSTKPTRARGTRSGQYVTIVEPTQASGGHLRVFSRQDDTLSLARTFSFGSDVIDFDVDISGQQAVVVTADGVSLVR